MTLQMEMEDKTTMMTRHHPDLGIEAGVADEALEELVEGEAEDLGVKRTLEQTMRILGLTTMVLSLSASLYVANLV